MFFKNLFKPRWQHTNPEIRRQALDALDPHDRDTLRRVAQEDPEPALRLLALQRLWDLPLLDRLAHYDHDPAVKAQAAQRLLEVMAGTHANGPSLQERLIWLGKMQDPAIHLYLLRHGVESALRSAVLDRISDEELLGEVAIGDRDARLRAIALGRIRSKDVLERVAKGARNRDKEVSRTAKERLAVILEEEARPQRLRVQAEALCADVEALARRGHWRDAAGMLDRVAERWQALESPPPADVMERFERAVAAVRQGLEANQAQQRQREAEEALLRPARQQKLTLIQSLEDLATDLAGRANLAEGEVMAAQALLQQAEADWDQVNPLPDAEEVRLALHFNQVCEQIRDDLGEHLHQAEVTQARRVLCQQIKSALTAKSLPNEATVKEWSRRWQALGAVGDNAADQDLANQFNQVLPALRERLRTAHQAREQALQRLEAAVEGLEQALERGELKSATGHLATGQGLLKEVQGLSKVAPLEARLTKAAGAVRELRDWQRWGNSQERERLCDEMEALKGSELPPEVVSQQIKQARDNWNQLGPLEKEALPLATRFNSACEVAFEPCRAYFAEQARQRELAAAAREALCLRVEEYNANTDWTTVDWPAAELFQREMRDIWQVAGLVDRKTMATLQQRFEAAMGVLQAERRREQDRNLQLKQTLVAKAEQAQQLTDLRVAVNEIKRLQQEWKTLGPAPRRHEHTLWKRLRLAADSVFEQRRLQTAARDEERKAAQAAREALCQQMEALAAADPTTLATSQGQLAELTHAWANAPSLAREALAPLNTRFQQALERYQQGLVRQRAHQAAEQLADQRSAAALCNEMEALAEQPGDPITAVAAVEQRWAALSHLPATLTERFQRARTLVLLPTEQRSAAFTAASAGVGAELETLAIRLEILAGLESPPEVARARLEYQVNRLATGLGQGSDQDDGRNSLQELESLWYGLGPVPATQRGELEARLARVQAGR